MKRLVFLLAAALAATSAFAQSARELNSFASDFQTVPVMANTPGRGTTFVTYVALLNPTSSSFPVEVTFYDSNGTPRTATITLAAGELKTYPNFLLNVFNATGGGAVTFRAPSTIGGTNRFIVNAEVWSTGGRYGTTVPALEFAGSASRSFAGGITVDSNSRTNIGCFNQSGTVNNVVATIRDASGTQTLGTATLLLPPNGWGQTAVNAIVTGGYVQFDPSDNAVCYAVVVDNATNDGRFVTAVEYKP